MIYKVMMLVMFAIGLMGEVMAVSPVSAEAEKVLGTEFTRTPSGGKLNISTGLVFINGRFFKPGYRVERRGNAIFINGAQVPSKGIEWTEFIKTQDGVERHEEIINPAPVTEVEAEKEVEEEVEVDVSSDDDISLDDLFDDNPKPKKEKKVVAKKKPKRVIVRKPTVVVRYSFDGEFKANEKTRQLVELINADRKRLENLLKADRFVFLGENYSQVTGEAGRLIEELPEIIERSRNGMELYRQARKAGIHYLSESICEDLMKNKASCIELQMIKRAREEEQELRELIGG